MNVFENEKKETFNFLRFLYKNRIILLLALVIGIGVATAITSFIPKKYRATAIVYPTNSFTRDQVLNNPQFGYETESEQLMQLLESESIRDSVVLQFDLLNYYELDSVDLDWRDQLTLRFISDITFFRSKYMSIVISATMTDPILSAEIVNYIVDVVNRFRSGIFSENRDSEVEYLKSRLDKEQNRLDEIVDQIYALKDSSVSDNLIYNYLLRSSKRDYVEDDFIDSPKMEDLIKRYQRQNGKLDQARVLYQNGLDELDRPFLKNYVIDKGRPSFKKTSPSYMVNGLIGGFGCFFAVLILLIIRLRLKELKAEMKQ